MSVGPLWKCSKCGRLFANRNQSHSCSRYTLREHLAGKSPCAIALFREFAKLVKRCGPVRVVPEKTRIAFSSANEFRSGQPEARSNCRPHRTGPAFRESSFHEDRIYFSSQSCPFLLFLFAPGTGPRGARLDPRGLPRRPATPFIEMSQDDRGFGAIYMADEVHKLVTGGETRGSGRVVGNPSFIDWVRVGRHSPVIDEQRTWTSR